jgi:hypothetical protein
MTDLTPFRKAFILCSAVALTSGLSACESKDLNKTFAQIKAIRVDANDAPATDQGDTKKLKASDVALVVQTAKDLTVNKGGLMDKSGQGQNKLQFAVVDPLQMPRIDHGQALDERVAGEARTSEAPMDILRAAIHDLPDVPITAPPSVSPSTKIQVVAKSMTPASPASGGRLVQIGSFSTMGAAQQAWSGLQTRFPAISRYSPSYQKITTASGQAMVRLKVGPVADEAQARTLCDRLDIQDSWCVKAS